MERKLVINAFRNIGFKDGKPSNEGLIINHSLEKGKMGDLVILVGANNSGKSNDGYVFFECRYTNALVDDKVVKEETTQVLETNLKPIQFGFFSKNGFKVDNKENYLLFTLEDIYK